MALRSRTAWVVAIALLTTLTVNVALPAASAEARPGFKRCRPAADVTHLDIAPKRRPCRTARSVARAWSGNPKCDPSGRAARNCTIRLSRRWGCQAQAFGFDPDSTEPYYVSCTRNFWHPMSGKPITAMVTFEW